MLLGAGGDTGTIAGSVTNDGTLIFNRRTDLVFPGAIAGSGTLLKLGTNRLTLSGDVGSTSDSAAAIDVRCGVLEVTGTLTTSDPGRTSVASGAALEHRQWRIDGKPVRGCRQPRRRGVQPRDRSRISGQHQRIGQLSPSKAPARLPCSAPSPTPAASPSAAASCNSAVAAFGGRSTATSSTTATLVFNRSDNYAQDGIISGSGTVTQQGSGTTTLSAVNSYSGLTRVDARTAGYHRLRRRGRASDGRRDAGRHGQRRRRGHGRRPADIWRRGRASAR